MSERDKPITDAVEILHNRIYKGSAARVNGLEESRENEAIARKIYELRSGAELTQSQLAKLIGTTASVICRLEDADYEGHSLSSHAEASCRCVEPTNRDTVCSYSSIRLAIDNILRSSKTCSHSRRYANVNDSGAC